MAKHTNKYWIKKVVEAVNLMPSSIGVVLREGKSSFNGAPEIVERDGYFSCTLDVRMDLGEDCFADTKAYQKGEAYVHTTPEFHEFVEEQIRLCLGSKARVQWNNTGSVANIYLTDRL